MTSPDGQTVQLLLTTALAIAGFFAVLWIHGIREDVRLAVASINEHASRLAKLEANLADTRVEVEKLRVRLGAA